MLKHLCTKGKKAVILRIFKTSITIAFNHLTRLPVHRMFNRKLHTTGFPVSVKHNVGIKMDNCFD
ncbi:UNVERIFIED_CONTAM: hypothetical protein NCL1_19528 [Trichonephila clavipes]